MWLFLSNANLNSIISFTFFGLYLSHLAAVNLDYCAWCEHTPSIPEMSAANLISKKTYTLRQSRCGFSRLQFKLLVYLLLEIYKSLTFVRYAVLFGLQ